MQCFVRAPSYIVVVRTGLLLQTTFWHKVSPFKPFVLRNHDESNSHRAASSVDVFCCLRGRLGANQADGGTGAGRDDRSPDPGADPTASEVERNVAGSDPLAAHIDGLFRRRD